MKALIVKGTTLAGRVINVGDIVEMEDTTFRQFALRGQAVAAPVDEPAEVAPEPAPAPNYDVPKRKSRKRK